MKITREDTAVYNLKDGNYRVKFLRMRKRKNKKKGQTRAVLSFEVLAPKPSPEMHIIETFYTIGIRNNVFLTDSLKAIAGDDAHLLIDGDGNINEKYLAGKEVEVTWMDHFLDERPWNVQLVSDIVPVGTLELGEKKVPTREELIEPMPHFPCFKIPETWDEDSALVSEES
jgi:hypothetical protein